MSVVKETSLTEPHVTSDYTNCMMTDNSLTDALRDVIISDNSMEIDKSEQIQARSADDFFFPFSKKISINAMIQKLHTILQ